MILSLVAGANAKSYLEVDDKDVEEPRIFFGQVVQATGLFPLEINVPDTISAMMSGMNYMYQSMSSYFSSSGSEGGEQSQNQAQVVYDEVDVNSRPINGKHRKKKVKKLKKKTSAVVDDEEDKDSLSMFDLFGLLMF